MERQTFSIVWVMWVMWVIFGKVSGKPPLVERYKSRFGVVWVMWVMWVVFGKVSGVPPFVRAADVLGRVGDVGDVGGFAEKSPKSAHVRPPRRQADSSAAVALHSFKKF